MVDFSSNTYAGKKDVYIIGAAVDKFPELHQVMTNLLPDGVQREDAGTGGGTAAGGAASRVAAKREGAELYDNTKKGRQSGKFERERRATEAVSTAVKGAVTSVMADVVMPAIGQGNGSNASVFRNQTEESESKSAALSFAQQQVTAYERWTTKPQELEAKEGGVEAKPFLHSWLVKKVAELEGSM